MTQQADTGNLLKFVELLRDKPESFYEIDGVKKLTQLSRDAAAAARRHARKDRRTSHLVNEIAFGLQNLAEADIKGTSLQACLEYWLTLGPLGWAMAVRHLNKKLIPFSQLEARLNKLPEWQLLLLFHQYSRSTLPCDQSFIDWCAKTLSAERVWDASQVIQFLLEIHEAQQTCDILIAERLAKTDVVASLEKLVTAPPPGKSIGRVLNALSSLNKSIPAAQFAAAIPACPPKDLPAMLRCVAACSAEKGSKSLSSALLKLLPSSDASTRLQAFHTLLRITGAYPSVPEGPQTSGQDFRSHPCMLLTDERAYIKMLRAAAPKERIHILTSLFAVLSKVSPDFVTGTLKRLIKLRVMQGVKSKEPFAGALEAIKIHDNARRLNGHMSERIPVAANRIAELEKRAFKPGDPLIKKALTSPYTISALSLKNLEASGHVIEKRTVKSPDFSGAKLNKLKFAGCSFSDADFTECLLDGVRFENCKFENARFGQSALRNVLFQGCSFKKTSFAGAVIESCVFSDVTFHKTLFVGTRLKSSSLAACDFQECSLWGAAIDECRFRSVRFCVSSLVATSLSSCILRGVELYDSSLDLMELERVEMSGTISQGCSLRDMQFNEFFCDDPFLLEAEFEYRTTAILAEGEKPTAVCPEWATKNMGLELAQETLGKWYIFREMRLREQLFLHNNRRRLEMTAKTLKSPRDEFFQFLPMLLLSDAFERHTGTKEVFPVCSISNYAPGYTLIELGRKHFKNFALTDPPGDAVRVETIYTIGSVGSIAMTEESDIDYWVCVHPQDADPKVTEALARKLALISEWADETFGLETTFFVMNMEDVRQNNFGFSDKESSGSAQALLLKEEFYRTALKLCGTNLAWWLTPVDADEAGYARIIREIQQSPAGLSKRFCDMGHMATIPKGEFFGASLWQIVKAFKSPFKSIMKFGLLERYVADTEGSTILLCERIKENLLARSKRLFDIDPYAVLFKEVRDYYLTSDNKAGANLINLAFLFKVDESKSKRIRVDSHMAQKDSLLEEFFGASGGSPFKDMGMEGKGFARTLELGNRINAFMLHTYDSVQSKLKSMDVAVQIDPVDLTKLGRKIIAHFAKKNHKVERIPFVNAPKKGFREMFFEAEKAPGKKPIWIFKALPLDQSSKKENYVEVKRELNMVRMLTWIVANKLFSAKALIDADRTTAPVAAQDLQLLLPALHKFFPPGKTFEVDLDETLKAERVVKAFYVLNLLAPRDSNNIMEASIIYLTNWGELFCLSTGVKNSETLRREPRRFLIKLIGMTAPADFEIGYFVPYHSKCPRISAPMS